MTAYTLAIWITSPTFNDALAVVADKAIVEDDAQPEVRNPVAVDVLQDNTAVE